MKSTWFNLTGFVQPATVVKMCNSKDDDGLMDRQLFACPNEIHYDYDEYRPLPESIPCLKAIFKEIDEAHPSSSISTYILQEDAKLEFIDELNDNQRIREQHSTDHDRKSVIGKGHGQLVRITCAHWALEQALLRIEQRQQNITVSPWNFQIPKDLILRAKILLDSFIEIKLALGLPPHSMEESDDETPLYDYHRIRRILELPTATVTPSQITQAHIPSRIDGRYTRESACTQTDEGH